MRIKDETYQEIKEQLRRDNKWQSEILYIILWILTLPFVLLWLFVPKPHEYVPDINNLPEPIQISTSGWTAMEVDGQKIYIDFLAEYDIQWRVLATRNYDDSFIWKIWNKISPRDFVLWWWPIMSKKENMKRFNADEYLIDRWVYFYPKTEYINWFNESFDVVYRSANYRNNDYKKFHIYYSNNHPIWSNKKINLLFKKIRVWDVIRLKWYLVKACIGSWCRWPSSLVRDDYWCEIIYVTDITWLKQTK